MNKEYALTLPSANEFNKYVNNALSQHEINEDEWYEINKVYFSKLYLSKDNPRAQSGHGGDEFHYVFSHLLILEAINKNGTLLDVGCANGYLIESLCKWATAIGFDLQMFGLDIQRILLIWLRVDFLYGKIVFLWAMLLYGSHSKNLIIFALRA